MAAFSSERVTGFFLHPKSSTVEVAGSNDPERIGDKDNSVVADSIRLE
jgi:hypothetical protein